MKNHRTNCTFGFLPSQNSNAKKPKEQFLAIAQKKKKIQLNFVNSKIVFTFVK
jgi:hypothetical protein